MKKEGDIHTTVTSTTSLAATAVKNIALELPAQAVELLRSEHERLSRDANPALAWNRFLHECILLGLDEIKQLNAEEALALVDEVDSGAGNV